VGALEDIVLSDDFTTLQNDFCNHHCGGRLPMRAPPSDPLTDDFEDTDENKFIYTEIFEQFTSLIGLLPLLLSVLPSFSSLVSVSVFRIHFEQKIRTKNSSTRTEP
jgi:hypothetical protein